MKSPLGTFAALLLLGLALGAQAAAPDSPEADSSAGTDADPEDAPPPAPPLGSLVTSVGAIRPELAPRYLSLISALLTEANDQELSWKNTLGLEQFAVDIVRSPTLLCGTVRTVERVGDADDNVFYRAEVEADAEVCPEERGNVMLVLPKENGVDGPPTALERGSYVIVPGFRRGGFQITIGQVYSSTNEALFIAGLRLNLQRVKALVGGAQ